MHVTHGDEQAFRGLTDRHRHELLLHCYRILGSLQDAEDVLQETLLAAWRGLDDFEGRASLRSWLYRIATNRCLNALRDSRRRPGEPLWLEPYPDVLLEDSAPGPEARYETRESIGLAFVAGLQHLPPQQRATLVLRDVLGFRAAEVAEILDISEAAVNGLLLRARRALDGRLAPSADRAPLPRSPEERALVGRFTDAFEQADIDGVVALLTEDARLTMPPEPLELHGHEAIARFLTALSFWSPDAVRLVATRANGQPAFGYYVRDPRAGIARAHGLLVLTLAGDRIVALTRFGDNSLIGRFGLPRTLRD
jgi:RNA polymerase sigma-70 factor (ECF subfamily)